MRRRLGRAVSVPVWVLAGLLQSGCGDGSSEPSPPAEAAALTVLRADGNTTCGRAEDGSGFCWGANEFGQLGDGTTTDRHRMTRVLTGFYGITVTGSHSCAYDGAAPTRCWGRNSSGEIGTGTTAAVLTPTTLDGNLNFCEVAIGDDFSCGIAVSGVTYCWGANDVGQLGAGAVDASAVPVPVAGNHQFRTVAAGGRTACGIEQSQMYCWGNGKDGELGNGAFETASSEPVPVAGDLPLYIVAIGSNAQAQATVCALGSDAIYCWGKNTDGEIGDGTTLRRNTPTRVLGDLGQAQVEPGGSHTCARSPGAEVYCWGKGGRLGTGSSQGSLAPVRVSGELAFSAITSGRDHTCGWTDDEPQRAYCWGLNDHGQLGDGTTTARLRPTAVQR
jgi:alpha-tubulin suppressor-like RCC1 family protein